MPLERLLLIDDDHVTFWLVNRLNKKLGIVGDLQHAVDGLAGLEVMQRVAAGQAPRPDVILLDVNMPRMNGFEFLEEYARMPEPVRSGVMLLMLTSSMLDRDRQRAEAHPFVSGFLDKPLTGEKLSRLAERYRLREPG